jgi:hypothetical protein
LVEKIGMLNLEWLAEALRCFTEPLSSTTDLLLYIAFIAFLDRFTALFAVHLASPVYKALL